MIILINACDSIKAPESNQLPVIPQKVSASDGIYSEGIAVTWDSSDRAVMYSLYRAEQPEGPYIIMGNNIFEPGYLDQSVVGTKKYYYRIKACSENGESEMSQFNEGYALQENYNDDDEQDISEQTPDDGNTVIPEGECSDEICATRGELGNRVMIAWEEIEGAQYYKVYRADNFYGPYYAQSGKVTEQTWIDDTVTVGRYYWYRVRPYWSIFKGKATKKVQGWSRPVPTSDSAHSGGVSAIIKDVLTQLPHWINLSAVSKKYQKAMPPPMKADTFVPSSDEIYHQIENVCDRPHRRIGSHHGRDAEDYIISELEKIMDGRYEVKTDPVPCNVYQVEDYAFKVDINGTMTDYSAFYMSNTGITESDGLRPGGSSVSGNLVWGGDGSENNFNKLKEQYGDLEGQIVAVECEVPNIPLGLIEMIIRDTYHVSDPNNSINLASKLAITAMISNLPHEFEGSDIHESSAYWQAYELGAEGLVVVLKGYPSNVNKHWGPYGTRVPMAEMPGVFVDNYSGDEIRELAQQGSMATIDINGTVTPGQGRNIYVQIPGESEETIFVTTHHDAAFEGATEDGSGIAMILAMAKTWKSMADRKTLPKTLLFHLSAGHFYGGKGAEVFAEEHRNGLLGKAIVNINLEHLAARKIKEDKEHNMILDGDKGALELLFVTEDLTAIAASRRMLQQHSPKATACIPGTFLGPIPPGESGHYHMLLGIDYIHYLGFPQYLLCGEDTLDKIDRDELNPLAVGVSELIGSYMVLPDNFDPYENLQ